MKLGSGASFEHSSVWEKNRGIKLCVSGSEQLDRDLVRIQTFPMFKIAGKRLGSDLWFKFIWFMTCDGELKLN